MLIKFWSKPKPVIWREIESLNKLNTYPVFLVFLVLFTNLWLHYIVDWFTIQLPFIASILHRMYIDWKSWGYIFNVIASLKSLNTNPVFITFLVLLTDLWLHYIVAWFAKQLPFIASIVHRRYIDWKSWDYLLLYCLLSLLTYSAYWVLCQPQTNKATRR